MICTGKGALRKPFNAVVNNDVGAFEVDGTYKNSKKLFYGKRVGAK